LDNHLGRFSLHYFGRDRGDVQTRVPFDQARAEGIEVRVASVALNVTVRVLAKNGIGMVTAEGTLVHDWVSDLQLDDAIVAGHV